MEENIEQVSDINIAKLSREELLKFVESKGLVKELAAEAKLIKVAGDVVAERKKATKTDTPEWELVMNDHNDFAIRKTKGKSVKMLVVMTSQGCGFLKDSKNTIRLTQENKELLYGFLRGMPRIEIPDSWIGYLEGSTEAARGLLNVLSDPRIMEGYKFGCGPTFKREAEDFRDDCYRMWLNAWDMHSRYLKEFGSSEKAKSLILAGPQLIKDIEKTWGIDNAKDFIKSFELSLVQIENRRGWRGSDEYESLDYSYYRYEAGSIRPQYNMDYKAFKDYVLYDAVRLGYAKKWRSFFHTWNDTLSLQMSLYRKIKDKYPDNLQCLHDLLSYKYELIKEEIDEANLAKALEEEKKFEGRIDKYIFIAPKNRQDFLDEAGMQQNCLASYVTKVANGDCYIIFMRSVDAPDDSLVTIELFRNGRLGQHYQARNVDTTFAQDAAIDLWMRNIVEKAL